MSIDVWKNLVLYSCLRASQKLMEALSTGGDLSFLSFPAGGTSFSFLRKYLVSDFRSFLLGQMSFPEKTSDLLREG